MKLAIIDKDKTLVVSKTGGYVDSPDDQILMPGVTEALAALTADGYAISIASNQGGVEMKHKTLDSAIEEMKFAMELTGISDGYFCPDYAGWNCIRLKRYYDGWVDPQTLTIADFANSGETIQSFRKPGAGMLQVARLLRQLEIFNPEDILKAIMIGDAPCDRDAAVAIGIPFIHADLWRSGAALYF